MLVSAKYLSERGGNRYLSWHFGLVSVYLLSGNDEMLGICLLEEVLSVAVSKSFARSSGVIFMFLSPSNHRPVS
jgi:hypothetical protein